MSSYAHSSTAKALISETLPRLTDVPSFPVGSTRSKNSKQTSNGLVKKTEVLKLDAALSPSPAQPKVNSKGLDVPELWAEEKSKRKLSAAFVVIGHVDHGKSTLMGRLLLDTGAVSQRDIDK